MVSAQCLQKVWVKLKKGPKVKFQHSPNDKDVISECVELAQLHADSLGIGAKFDSEYSAQARLSNSISPSDFPQNSESTAKQLLQFMDETKEVKVSVGKCKLHFM